MGRLTIASSLAIALLFAGCSPNNQPQDGAIAINIEGEVAGFFARNPDADAAQLLNANGKGFELYEDGSASFIAFGAQSNLRTRTSVASMSGNELCLSAVESWSGACMRFVRNPDRSYFVEGTYGSGETFRETLVLRPL